MLFIRGYSLLHKKHHAGPKKGEKMKSLQIYLYLSISLALAINADIEKNIDPKSDALLDTISQCFPQPTFPVVGDSITAQFNTYTAGVLVASPADSSVLATLIGSDGFVDADGTYLPLPGISYVAYSKNGGKSWGHSIPQPAGCDGGRVSQLPIGLDLKFGKDGRLYFLGAFADTAPFKRRSHSKGGIFVQHSDDGGMTWSKAVILDTTNSPAFASPTNSNGFTGGFGELIGTRSIGTIYPDHTDKDVVHVSWCRKFFPSTFYGNIWYARSKDRGESFHEITEIYDMANDTHWINTLSTTNICQVTGSCSCAAPNTCATCGPLGTPPAPICAIGGQSVGGKLISVPSEDGHVLLSGFTRLYPKAGFNASYTQTAADSLFDHAVVASYDHGHTWNREAYALPQYLFAQSHNPTIPVSQLSFSIILHDGSASTPMAISPKTGRVYMAWQGGDQTCGNDCLAYYFPRIEISTSADQGKTWSPSAVVSRTSLSHGGLKCFDPRDQAFNPNIAFLPSGLLGVIYTDFRNYTIGDKNHALADVWLALYEENSNISKNAGLKFVKEIQITKKSFDALIAFNNPVLPTLGMTEGLLGHGCNFFTTYTIARQGNLPACNNSTCKAPVDPACPACMLVDTNNRTAVIFKAIDAKNHDCSK
jgi:hypothetical protein